MTASALADDDPRHGLNGYSNLRCRCGRCRAAFAADVKRAKYSRPALEPDDPRHGTSNGYGNWNCRCPACTTAATVANMRRRQARRRP
jgi:hypothetical protein